MKVGVGGLSEVEEGLIVGKDEIVHDETHIGWQVEERSHGDVVLAESTCTRVRSATITVRRQRGLSETRPAPSRKAHKTSCVRGRLHLKTHTP